MGSFNAWGLLNVYAAAESTHTCMHEAINRVPLLIPDSVPYSYIAIVNTQS